MIEDKSYKNIVTINRIPEGPLQYCVVRLRRNKLSPFSEPRGRSSCDTQCIYVFTQNIYNIEDVNGETSDCGCGKVVTSASDGYLCVDQIPDLLSIATENNYTIDYKLSKLLTNTGVASSNRQGSTFVCTLGYVKPMA